MKFFNINITLLLLIQLLMIIQSQPFDFEETGKLQPVEDKLIFFNKITASYPKLNDQQKIRLAYFIGTQTSKRLFKDPKIMQEIAVFSRMTVQDKLPPAYKDVLKKMLLVKDDKLDDILLLNPSIRVNLFAQYQEDFFRYFQEEERKKITAVQNENKVQPSHGELQDIVDNFKKDVDLLNGKIKKTLKYYDKVSKEIKNNKLLECLKGGVEAIEKTGIVDNSKKVSARADLLSLIIKVEQGKANAMDIVNLTDKIERELGITILSDAIDIARHVLNIKAAIEKFEKGETAAEYLAELFIIFGNFASYIPMPLSQLVSKEFQMLGREIEAHKTIRSIINDEVAASAKTFEEGYEEGRMHLAASFFSDFALDDFVYCRVRSSVTLMEVLKDLYGEKFNVIEKTYETVKETISEVLSDWNEEVKKAHEEGRIDKYSAIGSDFADPDFMTGYSTEGIFNEIKNSISNWINRKSTSSNGGFLSVLE